MQNVTVSEWYGFRRIDFSFCDRNATVVFPREATEGKKWLFHTEYFGAFPSFEIEMLERGYHVVFLSNRHRWGDIADIDAKAELCAYLESEYGLAPKCMPVGMSCGGMIAVYFAAKYPERIAALYLDAPVMNFLSCPGCFGISTDQSMWQEFENATGLTKSTLINYRNHPIDHARELVEAKIPLMMIAGDCDHVVPYCENGQPLTEYYRTNGGVVQEFIKVGCDHHPHGLDDLAPMVEFTKTYY